MRLNQFLAKYLNISRRQADTLIQQGQVKVNNQPAQLGQQIDTETDQVHYQKKLIQAETIQDQVVLFYKSICCVCSHSDPQDRRTIYDFLPRHLHNLKFAGRLDFMSEGLLVLSNNGDIIQELTHPSGSKSKVYMVATSQPLTPQNFIQAKCGEIEIDFYKLQPVEIEKVTPFELSQFNYLKPNPDYHWYRFHLNEGRNNQIRKMCQFFGVKVARLIRIQQADYKLTKELFESKIVEVNM
jgi:23S rRNA pseudouridine2605 synthase